MRALTSAQEAKLFSTARQVFTRVRIADHNDTLQDYTVAGGAAVDWVDAVRITASVDQPVVTATVTMHREVDGTSLAPYLSVGTEAIKAGRQIQISAAIGDIGDSLSASDYWLLFDGFLDGWSTGGKQGTLELRARDRAGLLADTWTVEQNTYGSAAGTPMQTVMQSILNERFSTETFTTIGDPDFGIVEYVQGRMSMLDAIKALADLRGWLFRYRYNDGAGAFRFEFFEPDRDTATPVFTVTPADYYDISQFEESSDDVRNEGIIDWVGGSVTATDDTSVAEYRRTKTIVLGASQDIQLRTEAQAVALITAVVSDLSQPLATQVAELPLFPPVGINDYYRFNPNSALYSAAQDMAVTGFEHYIGSDGSRTTMQLRGQPSGGFTRWDSLRDRLERESVADAPDVTLGADDIAFYYTTGSDAESVGFVDAAVAADSLGGWVSTTEVSSAVNGLFRKVTETERVATITLYRSVAVVNNGSAAAVYDWEAVLAYLTEAASDLVEWAIAFDPQGVYPVEELLGLVSADEETAPATSPALTYYSPQTIDDSPEVGGETIPGGSGRIIHIRLTVQSGAEPLTTADALVFADQVPSS